MVPDPISSASFPQHHHHHHPQSSDHNPSSSTSSLRDSSFQQFEVEAYDYEQYLRLPALSKLWTSKHFPEWKNESILKPSLQALEITFRLISIALSDPRPYSNHRQWKLRLEALASHQIEIIALLCQNYHDHYVNINNNNVPLRLSSLNINNTSLIPRPRDKSWSWSSHEVWKLNAANNNTLVVSHTSEASLLPRLAAWEKSQDVATKILFEIESQMQRCPFTLGLGEPNFGGKPSLEYDLVVQPSELHSHSHSHSHSLKINNNNNKSPVLLGLEQEKQMLLTVHQIIESWLCTAQQLLNRIGERIEELELEEAASDCWVLERIWMLLTEIEDVQLLMDPDDFLRLKTELNLNAATSFKSKSLISVTNSSKELLKQKVPQIVGVEADPSGGPRVQEAAMKLFHSRTRAGDKRARIHLLQAFQAIEAAVKRFFFAYRQLIIAVMGSLEATTATATGHHHHSLSLSDMFMDPPYFPSLDAAKTFLGELWHRRKQTTLPSASTSTN